MSMNPEVDPDIAALIGTSRLAIDLRSAVCRPRSVLLVGYIDGQYVLNPTLSAAQDLATRPRRRRYAIGRADGRIGKPGTVRKKSCWRRRVRPTEMQKVINAINELVEEAGKPEVGLGPRRRTRR